MTEPEPKYKLLSRFDDCEGKTIEKHTTDFFYEALLFTDKTAIVFAAEGDDEGADVVVCTASRLTFTAMDGLDLLDDGEYAAWTKAKMERERRRAGRRPVVLDLARRRQAARANSISRRPGALERAAGPAGQDQRTSDLRSDSVKGNDMQATVNARSRRKAGPAGGKLNGDLKRSPLAAPQSSHNRGKYRSSLGLAVRARREKLRMSVEQLVNAVNANGGSISVESLYKYESGRRPIQVDDLPAFAAALQTTVKKLVPDA